MNNNESLMEKLESIDKRLKWCMGVLEVLLKKAQKDYQVIIDKYGEELPHN